ncbi:hypothetical protein [endosymbiont DhMRE of Dentiscutata heterogama]|uniref:hypothetical protein n=1 Tax=endosymbiont DhMRE of Dentiscutata heterogama TaxID=1609546 RepID=UPI002AD39CA1|nr:hypothetical protein [endosymbiont DhMRE of Dentiscutata heterogama]
MEIDTHTHTHTHTKKSLYRWIGLVIGLILGIIFGFVYYSWWKKQVGIHFQESIGERKFIAEYQKWATKNPLQAREMAIILWKEMGLYEELKNETNQEIIQRKVMKWIEEATDEEKKRFTEKSIEVYKSHAPSFLKIIEEKFPWHLRYWWVICLVIVTGMIGSGFLVGYLVEPKKVVEY